jgi:hypothetical protein
MHSARLQQVLSDFLTDAAHALQAEVIAGAEVPFDLEAQSARRRIAAARGTGRASGPLFYAYRPLTDEFIAARRATLERLPTHADALRLLAAFEGLDRYLMSWGIDPVRLRDDARAHAALRALMHDVFAEQSEFELREERLAAALARLELAGQADASVVTVLATLHGVTLASPEVQLTHGLLLAHPQMLDGLPEEALPAGDGSEHMIAVLRSDEQQEPRSAIAHGREILEDLLRALRLFGDGRVTLGALGWTRIGSGQWNPLAIGNGGRPHGMLLVSAEQEDELRAFCNLVSRRAPSGNEVAWALRRFELGCERDSVYEALSDHLLALRALLEPEGTASGMLAGRLAALCATVDQRAALTERTARAVTLERTLIAGAAPPPGAIALTEDLAGHLRALLRDVICGHLDPDLAGLADEILLEPPAAPAAAHEDGSVEDVLGYASESQEVLDLSV